MRLMAPDRVASAVGSTMQMQVQMQMRELKQAYVKQHLLLLLLLLLLLWGHRRWMARTRSPL
jgi:hypothetical protein